MSYILTYYPWITQHKTSEEIRTQVQIFSKALGEQLKQEIIIATAMEVPEQIQSIVAGKTHVALMNPLGFVYAREHNPNVDAAVVALRIIDGKIGDSYFAQIYAHVDTGIKGLEALRKHSIGYGTSQSTSNFIIPAFDLKKAGVHPFAAFNKIEFTGGHDKAAKAVYYKQVDAGAGHDGAIIDLANQPGYEDAKEKLVQIHRSAPIPSDPIAVNVPTKKEYVEIQKALVAISQKSPAKEAIAEFWGKAQGLKETTYKPYEYLLRAVNELGLTQGDIFG
jgi:phosphate/phosphite/phosphonate ABC transporter binding protein